MKKLKIKAAIRNEVVEMYVAQNGGTELYGPMTFTMP